MSADAIINLLVGTVLTIVINNLNTTVKALSDRIHLLEIRQAVHEEKITGMSQVSD